MNRILCSTGAIVGRPNGRDITLLGKFKEIIECDGYEFMMYDTWYDKLDEIRSFMENFNRSIPVFHVEKSIGELISRNSHGDLEKALELFEINCTLAKEFGAEKLVLHLWNGVESDKNIEHNIDCYKYLRRISDTYNIMLTVENVVCSHKDPMSHLISLAKTYPDIQFTFDTKMAAFHNQIELLYKEENRYLFDRVRHMHINDYGGGYKDFKNLKTLHIGDGYIDFDRFFAFLKQMNYQWDFTVEATAFDGSGKVDSMALNMSLHKIREYIG